MGGDQSVQAVAAMCNHNSTAAANVIPPLVSSYNHKIRPLLDAIDKLRRLKVTQEGIPLPTIVVVGDQSSGKSSVLESLAGISLPRGQGICTRVPLVMRLQNYPGPVPEIQLEFHGKSVPVNEDHISEAIKSATDEIAGNGKGISNVPLTLVVKKNGVPDLTMFDLPGITRVPVHGQPENIYEQISDIISEYIKPKESIILNVLSATVDFPTCESIRMSQKVDKTGQRTLAVVTKADKAPEGLLEKVTADDVNIGLGYVCVRNRIGDETYEEARAKEVELFESHPLLSNINKSMVGIPVLAQKLVLIQSSIISKCLPDIVKKINDKLNTCVFELSKLPRNPTTVDEAITKFMQIISQSKETLRKLMITSDFDEYPDETQMHSTARIREMVDEFFEQLNSTNETLFTKDFLVEEIRVLEEAKGIRLPNFLSHSAFHSLLRKKVASISDMPGMFVVKLWDYIEAVVVRVLVSHSEHYPQLLSSIKNAARSIIGNVKVKLLERASEMVEMERVTDYTCDGEFLGLWNKLMLSRMKFIDIMNDNINRYSCPMLEIERFKVVDQLEHPRSYNQMTTEQAFDLMLEIEGFGVVEVGHLRSYNQTTREQAFDLKMMITAYWKIVVKRLVDWVALQLQLRVEKLVSKEMEVGIVNELMGEGTGQSGIGQMLEESPSVAMKREKLKTSIELLKSSKEVIGRVMDRIDCLHY